MARTAVTPSPGFISIQVSNVDRSAEFYEQHLGAVRDTFDFGPDAVAYVGWPTFGLNAARRPGRSGPPAWRPGRSGCRGPRFPRR